jgi:C4-dicarboxylate transporter DctM subunit
MVWVMVVLPLALLLMGAPIFLVLLVTDIAALLFFVPVPHTVIHQVMFGSIDKVALLAVPFFIFAGEMMSRGGVSQRLLNLMNALVGNVRGSLPLTALGTATIFGAISGATVASVAAVGSLTYEPLRKQGYSERFSSAMLTSAGAIANLIPPSIAMIVYGFATQTSVVDLFAAGILPGLVLSGFFAAYIFVHAARQGIRVPHRLTLAGLGLALRDSLWALGAPLIILGGIYTGVFSPTEAAGVASVYAIVIAMGVYREVGPAALVDVAANTAYLTAQIMIIIAAGGVYSWLLTATGTAQLAVDFISALNLSPWLFLLVTNAFLLLVGTVLDPSSAIIVLSPLLASMALALGVDPIHFGVIVVMNLSIGTFTPPFGLNIFTGQAIFKVPLSELYPGLMPFIALAIAALMLVTYVPGLSLWILRIL